MYFPVFRIQHSEGLQAFCSSQARRRRYRNHELHETEKQFNLIAKADVITRQKFVDAKKLRYSSGLRTCLSAELPQPTPFQHT